MVIIHSDNNNIFGGYTSVSWKNNGGVKTDNTAFLFLIKSSKNYVPQIFNLVTYKNQTIHHGCNYLIAFGVGCDIYIHNNCNTNSTSYTYSGSYDIPQIHYLNGGQRHSKVINIEVFNVK